MEDNNNTSSAKKEVNELNTNNSNRIITNIYDCLQRRFGPVRIVGSVDIDGYGTSHNITGAETDPFVLSEYVRMPAHIKPPFCAHPHAGACVISIQLEGYDIQPWDNLRGDEDEVLKAGGIYLLQSGSGCVHDEPNVPILSDKKNTMRRFFQIWTNPDIFQNELPPPYSKVVSPETIPAVQDGDVRVRILVGAYLGVKGAIQIESWSSTTILHAIIPQGKHGSIAIPEQYNAHLFVESGSASFVGRNDDEDEYKVDMSHSQFKILLSQPHTTTDSSTINKKTCPRLQVYNIGKEKKSEDDVDQGDLEVMIFMGIPHNKPFYKLLGYGGALMHKNEELVRALMLEYEKNPKDFGRNNASFPPNTSDEKYEMIEGKYEKGDDAKPGLLGR
eukprot:CAMPEP_0194173650 /NCGR_PEP_ID=MMETSP0154-20130528/7930_1 /TAXON_ID=1049557 /ORGANISM="Thalassiothrix antarctica, Strain L6-D1" /LENGTH=387 /DNA_ID=CAMNT_0038886773 /DNA_START=100 /DNA_END=1260 /DNA_ORIENTATION=+